MKEKIKRKQTLGEEIANAVSHGVGALLAIAGLSVLVVKACVNGLGAKAVVSASLYGTGLVLLYVFSALYHSLKNEKAKKVFRIFDHCSIFLLILCSYIPIFLYVIGGAFGWTMFGISTFCTVCGIVLNSISLERWDRLSQVLYIVMGWQAIVIIKTLYSLFSATSFAFLIIGGLAYTVGIIFYKMKKVKYTHFVWHLFVLAGSIFHYFMILGYYVR